MEKTSYHKVATMQPYIFPYLGYFQLINSVDTFVFLIHLPPFQGIYQGIFFFDFKRNIRIGSDYFWPPRDSKRRNDSVALGVTKTL